MRIRKLHTEDLRFYILLSFLYAVIYIPRTFVEFPSNYRPAVQRNMGYVAETIAHGGNPYTPPYPGFYSTAGGHLHGVAGAPFIVLVESAAAPRLGVLMMGCLSLIVFHLILKEIGLSHTVSAGTTVLLSIYPQFILFHSAGNPSAADLFFGLIAVFGYLRWHSEQTGEWLITSSVASGAAVFSHFYSGVVAIGILSHYAISTSIELRQMIRTATVYATGMLPAGLLLLSYKIVFSESDPASHYFNRLLFNSFDKLYATEQVYGTAFGVLSQRFIIEVLAQHGSKSPLFGRWWMVVLATIVLAVGWWATPTGCTDPVILVLTWIGAGLLPVILIPGGVIYHDYYTWWLLLGVFAGLAWSVESLLVPAIENRNPSYLIALVFPTVLTGCLVWFSFTSWWTGLIA